MTGSGGRVIVVGGGPVGLTAAVALARQGVPVTVFERRPQLVSDSRAATFHPATLDVLSRWGLADALTASGTLVDRVQWRSRQGRVLAEMSMLLLDGLTGHPYRLHAEQRELIALLARELARYPNAQVRVAAPVDAINGTASGLRVRAGGVWETADYVVAADGAHSTVRAMLAVPFVATPYPTQALRILTDSPLDQWLPGAALAPLTYVRDRVASCSLLQLPDHWRIVLRLPPGTGASPSRQEAAALARRALPIRGRSLHIVGAHTYRLARGVLEHFRHGRVLFVGDAAHLTSTAGGLNMNAGMHEAATLADALAAVLGGAAAEAALGEWAERSRRIILKAVIPRSEARVAGVQDGDRARLDAAMARLRAVAADPASARTYLAEASLLDIIPNSIPTPDRGNT
ncbi:NAD(P)/FAD-dependent oxidoreductase [Nonomuraea sp. NPDC046802]|uniref:FAD-dependent oxidoreductase n=1 Tax=Nonomuraea sp. NPDC046802 TaxID=3154919 RepID=UPI0033DA3338